MKNKRRNHTAAFKAKVALALAKGDKTIAELASEYGVILTRLHNGKSSCLHLCRRFFLADGKMNSTSERS